jgi:hypothetical protein
VREQGEAHLCTVQRRIAAAVCGNWHSPCDTLCTLASSRLRGLPVLFSCRLGCLQALALTQVRCEMHEALFEMSGMQRWRGRRAEPLSMETDSAGAGITRTFLLLESAATTQAASTICEFSSGSTSAMHHGTCRDGNHDKSWAGSMAHGIPVAVAARVSGFDRQQRARLPHLG